MAACLAVGHALENNVLGQGHRAEVGHEQQRSEPHAQRVQACMRKGTQSHAFHVACVVSLEILRLDLQSLHEAVC